jgi:hypothetical protein
MVNPLIEFFPLLLSPFLGAGVGGIIGLLGKYPQRGIIGGAVGGVIGTVLGTLLYIVRVPQRNPLDYGMYSISGGFIGSIAFASLLAGLARLTKKSPTKGDDLTRVSVKKGILLGGLICLAFAALIAIRPLFSQKSIGNSQETQWVEEAQAAVEAFLRNGKQAANGPETGNIDNKVVFDKEAIIEKFGSLQSISGSGYGHPAWNIQGYHYLTAQRTAHFSKGPVPLKIQVTEGRVTAPSRTDICVKAGIQYDSANHMTIFVSHPQLHP